MPVPTHHDPPRSIPGPGAVRRPTRTTRLAVAGISGIAAFALLAGPASAAQHPVGLGVASSFSVLSGSAVTNVGPTTISGDLGVSPGTAVSGFPPGLFNGTLHVGDAVANQAQSDVTAAFGDAASRTPPLTVSGDLGGRILTPGVYRGTSSVGLTGTVTLDAQGDPNAVFVMQVGSTLTTASASRVLLVNGAQPCNVTWQIGSSATLGSGSTFVGNLLAQASISVNDAVTVRGRLLARSGAVTLINDTIVTAPCAPGTTSSDAASGGGSTTTPDGAASAGGSTGSPGGTAAATPGGATRKTPGTATLTTTPRRVAQTIGISGTDRCVLARFRAEVTGLSIRRVTFYRNGRVIGVRNRAPYAVTVNTARGVHRVVARVSFTNGARTVSLPLRFRSCGPTRAAVANPKPSLPTPSTPNGPSRPPRTPSGFAG